VVLDAIVVTGSGEAHCDPATGDVRGAEHALSLLALAGKDDGTIRVACGEPAPLHGTHRFPEAWRADADTALGLALPASARQALDPKPGATVLVETLEAGHASILALGPLTDLGRAFADHPDVVRHVDGVTIMGGAVAVAGNLEGPPGVAAANRNTTAEWNFYVDPAAANVVLRAGAPVWLVPLDGTNHAPVTRAFFDRLAATRRNASSTFVWEALGKNVASIERGSFFFWDPMAAAIFEDPTLCAFDVDPAGTARTYRLAVVTAEGTESGRIREDSGGSAVHVCARLQPGVGRGLRFEDAFLAAVESGR
jgi:inosine-uridine nucleoside N-ribohydrolase